jgi:chromosome segregation ATPase
MRYRQKCQAEVRARGDELRHEAHCLQETIGKLEVQLQERNDYITDHDGRFQQLARERDELSGALRHIHGSRGWRILVRLHLIKNRILSLLGLSRAV